MTENKIVLLKDVDPESNFEEYYCANIVEKTFECSNKLLYIKNGGFGCNYNYCSSCYSKWNKLKNPVNKYYQEKGRQKYKKMIEEVDFID